MILQCDGGRFGRTKPPHGSTWLRGRNGGRITGRHSEGLHAKGFGRVRVLKHGAANTILADNGAYAGKRYVQPRCFGKLRRKEAKLHLACAAGFGRQCQSQDGGLRWMGFEIEVKKFNPELFVRSR